MQKSAEKDNGIGQGKLGFMYYDGKGVKQDYFKAAELFLKSAEKGDAIAQGMLGVMYADGLGVRQSYSEAKKWYGKSCDNKNQFSCDNYAHLNK